MTDHSPAQIIASLVIASGRANLPGQSGGWPLTYNLMPDSPDNFITIYDTDGSGDGRIMRTGEMIRHPGIQLRVRAQTHGIGYTKAIAIATYWDSVASSTVTIDGKNYRVQNISRRGDILALGQEPGKTRVHFTVNAILTLKQL